MLRQLSPPAWVFPGATFDLNFSVGQYWGNPVNMAAAIGANGSYCSLVQGSTSGNGGYAPDSTGIVRTFAAYYPRITAGCGLWAEGNYTNYALYSNDHTNGAWTKTSMTAAKNQTGADLTANGASLLTATGTSATSLQSLTLSSHAYCFSAYVKRVTGTGTVKITLDGTTYTDVTGQINSTGYTLVSVPAQTLTSANVGFQLGTSGDAIAVQFCQCENNNYPTTPLPTTTSTNVRGIDEPAHSDPGGTRPGMGQRVFRDLISSGGPWSMLQFGSGNGYGTGSGGVYTDGGVTVSGVASVAGAGGNGSFTAHGISSGTTSNTGNIGLNAINKIAGRANGAGVSCCLNGGPIVTVANTGALTPQGTAFTHMGLGNNGASGVPINGYTSRLVYFPFELTDSQMIEYTR
ncbi:phage head spike fiber domain-containing protein [Fimbriiglobus ruber]|uniref:Uncharacterized protein n=1 Tax=Fimbriiglobus ruber TaxID=1908690 RepID=A0A225E0L3_9BACT|nr:hypothetical protein [Fimbriiglobus ruber]OWK42215.1 hypothetical protein FRUB_04293 [Fimbriiglobus ruber]